MSPRLQRTVARRDALIEACAEQRARLAAESAEVERALWFVEPAARALRVISSRPLLVALAAGTLLVLGPRRVLVRGWVMLRNGPMIELTHPEAIELLEEG